MSQYIRNELEFLLMPLRRFVDVSREVAPSLDGLFEKDHFISCDEICNLERVFLDYNYIC